MNKVRQNLQLKAEVVRVSERTARVRVVSKKRNSLYQKSYTISQHYLADIPVDYKVEAGQEVVIERSRPLSKRKHWQIKVK